MKKKIGLLIPSLQAGGAERVLSITSKLLSEKGYEVYFFVYLTEDLSYKVSGKLINLKSTPGKNVFQKILRRITRTVKLSYYKKKFELDAVISFLYSANVVNYYSIGKADRIISCRGFSDFKINGKKYSKMLTKVESFIVQTERLKNSFIATYNVKDSDIQVIHNPFDIESIQEQSKEAIEPHISNFIRSHKTICTLGSFKKDKGYWHLIRSFVELKKNNYDVGIIFIGNKGEMESQIKRMAHESEFEEAILFLDYQSNPFKYIAKCDLFVSTSLYEGFPNAIVEAMACGIPIVSTDCPTGPREILTESITEGKNDGSLEYGVLTSRLNENIKFHFNDIEVEEKQLAKTIERLINDKKLLRYYREMSLKRANMFTQEQYINLIMELLNRS